MLPRLCKTRPSETVDCCTLCTTAFVYTSLQVVPLRSVHPKFLFGSGKAAEMAGAVSAADADTVFVNAPLSGQQQKALSSKWGGSKVRCVRCSHAGRISQDDGVLFGSMPPSALIEYCCRAHI